MNLTPYDQGTRLEPKPWHVQPKNLPDTEEADRYGRVDFDNEEGATGLTLYVEYDRLSEESTLHIENVTDGSRLRIAGDGSGPRIEAPSPELQERVDQTILDLRTFIEMDGAEVFWNGRQALILVPGEEHVRRQQLILVSDHSEPMSAIVNDWSGGVHDTRID